MPLFLPSLIRLLPTCCRLKPYFRASHFQLRNCRVSPPSLAQNQATPWRRNFSDSYICGQQRDRNQVSTGEETVLEQQFQRKKSTRSQSNKNSLRRVAVAFETAKGTVSYEEQRRTTKLCIAYCTAQKYDLSLVAQILGRKGYVVDPFATSLVDQVLHIRLPTSEATTMSESGDIFIFSSGNIVSWSVPSNKVSALASIILPAAENPYQEEVETEDLEYIEDPRIRKSRMGGDVIMLGTAPSMNFPLTEDTDLGKTLLKSGDQQQVLSTADELNVTLAKVAFSSGLARSTKLAVLESLLYEYLTTISKIPTLLSKGSRLPFTRSFILRKTGELLEFRAQLNLYSELTDSLPDIFWDSRHELGLEGYYESVGRALDVNVRIKQLNEKLDYASGIVEVLRQRLSERHALGLEWMIILLITVEVGFEVLRLWKEGSEDKEGREYRRWKERREREEDREYQKWRVDIGGR